MLSAAAGWAQSDVPPGFEDLTRPESALIDVYFRDQLIGQYLATFAPGWVQFERPGELARDVPDIADREALTRALDGRLDSNAERLCRPGVEDCGYVETQSAAVLFNRGQFRADLIVGAPLLGDDAQGPRYLPTPPSRPSFVQSLAAAGSGTTSGEVRRDAVGTLRSLSVLGFGRERIEVESSASSVDGLALDTAFAEADRQDRRFTGGLYRATPVPTVGQRRIVGAGVETTLDLRTDIAPTPATPLFVTLQRRAVVEIVRDGRVLDSRVYPAGTQRLETRTLPRGAYDVTIRVRQLGGGTRTIQRFFVKDSLIPPAEDPSYTFNVGVLADNASPGLPATGDPVVHAGHNRKLFEGFGLSGDLAATPSEGAGELALAHVNRFAQLTASVYASTDLQYGAGLRAFGRYGKITYSAQLRQRWAGDGESATDVDPDAVPELVPDTRGGTDLDLTLDYLFEDGARLGVFADLRRSAGRADSWRVGPTLRYPVYADNGLSLDLTGQASFGRDETFAFVSLRVNWFSGRFRADSEVGYLSSNRSQDSGVFADVGASVQAIDTPERSLNLGVGASRGATDSARADATYRGPATRGDISVERGLGDTRATSYAGTASTTLVGDPDSVALVGDNTRSAAVVIEVGEAADPAEFDVLVDDRKRAQIQSGGRVAVPLEAYERYRIRLKRTGGGFVDYDNRTRSVTVFPGNVRTLRWETASVVSVFAQVVRPDGTPVANALIDGTRTRIRTDDLGYFQAEIGTAERLRVGRGTDRACTIDLPDLPPEAEFRDLGELECIPLGQ